MLEKVDSAAWQSLANGTRRVRSKSLLWMPYKGYAMVVHSCAIVWDDLSTSLSGVDGAVVSAPADTGLAP